MTDEEIDAALVESRRVNGCVPNGRFDCCAYHEGFLDALLLAQEHGRQTRDY